MEQFQFKDNLEVLIVDDDLILAKVLEQSLNLFNCKVTRLADGMELVDFIRRHHSDLIFLDNDMPNMTGTEALTFIRTRLNYQGPVISYSTSNERWTPGELNRMGYSGKLPKPFKFQDLAKLLYKL